MIEFISGDLLCAKEKYIAHTTNCVSTGKAIGIAKLIFDQFPFADSYINRVEISKPGTINIMGNGKENRYIINLNAIYYPGISKYPNSKMDGLAARKKYFHQCLLEIAKIPNLESIAFPFRIACGAAGGDWTYCLGTLNNFADYVKKTQNTKVVIYQREVDEEKI